MKHRSPDYSWLSDPEVSAVNRRPAHSDHAYYESIREAEQKAQMPLRQSLNGIWRFSYAPEPSLRAKDFYKMDFDCSGFASIRVPGSPHPLQAGDEPAGSYICCFTAAEALRGKSVAISFQGVAGAFYVWLNGHFVGYSGDAAVPSEFRAEESLREGENKLAVEVYRRPGDGGIEAQDLRPFTGIFRDVCLYAIPRTHVEDIRVESTLDEGGRSGILDVRLKLTGEIRGKTAFILKNRQGRLETVETRETEQRMHFVQSVPDAHPWSPEDPYFYTLYVHILDENNDLVESVPVEVGFRAANCRSTAPDGQ